MYKKNPQNGDFYFLLFCISFFGFLGSVQLFDTDHDEHNACCDGQHQDHDDHDQQHKADHNDQHKRRDILKKQTLKHETCLSLTAQTCSQRPKPS